MALLLLVCDLAAAGVVSTAVAELERGLLAARNGDASAALAHLHEAWSLEPGWSVPPVRIGSVHAVLERELEQAEAMYERALQIDPGAPDAARLRDGLWSHHLQAGERHGAAGEMAEAEASYAHAVRLAPTNSVAYGRLAQCLNARGESRAAVAAYEIAASLAPADHEAHVNLGLRLDRDGRRDDHRLGRLLDRDGL